jgi:hypothetical protein
MQLHINKSPNVNSEENLPAINGRGLAHRKLSRAERADLAADLVSGRRQFTPSLGQVSALLRVAPGIVREKLRFRARQNGHTEAAAAEAIVQSWNSGSDSDREVAFRRIGVAEVWDVLSRIIA